MTNKSIASQESSYLLDEGKFQISNINSGLTSPIHFLKYDDQLYTDQLFSTFNIQKPKQLSSWVSKRKAQFLAGRLAANRALECIDHSFGSKPSNVLVGQLREPLWPNGFIGSISHTPGASIAVAHHKDSSKVGVGLDVQTTLKQEEINSTKDYVLTEDDQKLIIKGDKSLTTKQFYTLIFSAKESFFKAAFNSVNKHFNFDAVSIQSVNFKNGQITLICNQKLSAEILKGNVYILSFEFYSFENRLSNNEFVFSYCLI